MTDQTPAGGSPGQQDRKPLLDLQATGATEPGAAPPPPPLSGPPPAFLSPNKAPPPATPVHRRRSILWPVAAVIIAVGLVLTVLLAPGTIPNRWFGPLEPSIARLQLQVSQLAAKRVAIASNQREFQGLSARLAKLEAAASQAAVTDNALAKEITGLQSEIKILAERVAALARRTEEVASAANAAGKQIDTTAAAVAELRKAQATAQSADVEAMANRIASIERTSKAMEAQLRSRLAAEGTERSLRTLVLASALRAVVDRGLPFVGELEAAKAVAPDPKVLAPLDRFAKTGIPNAAAIAQEFAALLPDLARSIGTTPRDSILNRLKANAEKIVRVRPTSEAANTDIAGLIQRIEANVAQGNLPEALAGIGKLPPLGRVATQDWVAKVEARNAAVEASQRYYTDALAALGKPSL